MANIEELKEFAAGGLDMESAPQYVQPNDFVDAVNIRVTGTQDSERGDVTDIASNALISAQRSSGININVGSEKFEDLAKAYTINYNSQGYHTICELDKATDLEKVIFQDITDTGGVSILNLNPEYRINKDIKVLHKKFLMFTDAYSSVKCINLERLKAGEYGIVREEDITLIKAQPFRVPTYVYGDNAGRSTNLMRGHLFQFREQYEYLDYQLSTWGTISKRNVPVDEPSPTASSAVSKNNNVIITVDAGSDRVVKLNIAGRYELMDWFLIKSIERSYVTSLKYTIVDIANEIYEAYDPFKNVYSFVFYNDGLYSNIDVLETDEPYDAVPDTAESIEIVNGSIVALAGITEGKPRPTTKVDFNVTYYDPHVEVVATDQTTALRISNTDTYRLSNSHVRSVNLTFSGVPKVGDKVTIVTTDIRDSTKKLEYAYTAVLADQGNLDLFLQHVSASISQPTWYDAATDRVHFETVGFYALTSATIGLANISVGSTKSIPALKLNSSYQLALRYYDKNGKFFPLLTGKDFVVNTKSFAQTKGLLPQINWVIAEEKAPEGAVGYQILMSQNNTHKSNLYVVAKSAQTIGNYVELNINTLQDFNKRNPSSILSYDYTEGDRVTFVSWVLTQLPGQPFYFNNPPIDVQVLGFEARVNETTDPKTVDYYLRIAKSNQFDPAVFVGADVLIEIYTPKRRSVTDVAGNVTAEENLWYEIGEQFTIQDGRHMVLNATIKEGDSYYKSREFTLATNNQTLKQYMVEDFNFSDYYKSNYNSAGRPATYYDEPGVVERGASIRTSEPSVIGSRTNGMNRFYAARIYGDGDGQTSINYGKIKKIRMRDNTLVCIQEIKIGHIPVFKSYIADLAENQNVAISDRLFNNVVYIASGQYGMGNAKESFAESKKGVMYFVDPNNSVPVRDGYDGVLEIPGKMGKFFERFLKSAYDSGAKIYGIFDDENKEYNVSIESQQGIASSFLFSEDTFRSKEPFRVNTLTLQQETLAHGTVSINTSTGSAVFTPENNYTGKASFAFSFLVNGARVIKNVCFNVLPANLTIKPFYFEALYGKPLSTEFISGSALIEGNNNPVNISVAGGSYSINGGAFTTSASKVANGDTVRVKLTTGGQYEADNRVVLTVNGYSSEFIVRTMESPDVMQYVWANIERNGILLDPVTGSYYETVFVRTYKGSDPGNAPQPTTQNLINYTVDDLVVEKHCLQNTQFLESMPVDMNNVSEVMVIPLPTSDSSRSPKHLTRDNSYDYFFTFPGKNENEMINLTPTQS